MSETTDLFAVAQRLQQQGKPYALVSVVRTQAPTSARAGDKALITSQGILHGWIGGGCVQPVVLQTVRQALQDGRARLIRIAPADLDLPPASESTLEAPTEFEMSCHSGGMVELFVDPILPPMQLVVIGDSPVAVALAGLAPRIGLPVTVIAHGADVQRFTDASHVIDTDDAATAAARVPADSLVVVATQGRRDLQGLRAGLALQARKIWLVASTRKAQMLRESLIAAQEDPQAVNAIIAPAGQPIGAQTPEEIALSVLAAVVAVRRTARGVADATSTPEAPTDARPEANAQESPTALGAGDTGCASTPRCCSH